MHAHDPFADISLTAALDDLERTFEPLAALRERRARNWRAAHPAFSTRGTSDFPHDDQERN